MLREILRQLKHHPVIGFTPIQESTMVPLAPGQTAGFVTTSLPTGTSPNPAALPVWTSSDTVNAPVTINSADTTGLSASVVFPTTAVVGTTFALTITYTNADGTVATQTDSFTIVAPASPDITGFTPIVQNV